MKHKGPRHFKKFLPGEVLVKEGQISGWAFLILSGRVRVTKKIGGKEQVLAELGPNDLVGELSIVDKKPRSATVTAIIETNALMLNLAGLKDVMHESPETAIVVFRALANKLRVANEKLLRGYSPGEVEFWYQLLTVTKLWVDATANRSSERTQENLRKTLHITFRIEEEEVQGLINRMIAGQILADPSEAAGLVVEPKRLNQFIAAYNLIHAEQQTRHKLTLNDLDVSRHVLGVVERKFGDIPDSQVIMPTPELKEAVLSTDLWLKYPEIQREQFWDECVTRLTKHGLLGWRFGQRAEIIILIKKMRYVLTLGLEPEGRFQKTCDLLTTHE